MAFIKAVGSCAFASVALLVVTGCGSDDTGASGSGAASGAGAAASGPSGPGPASGSATGGSGTTASGAGGSTGSGGDGGSGPVAPLHFIGRWDTSDAAHPSARWPGSAIYARFSGTGVDLTIDEEGNDFLAVVIDDGEPTVVETSGGMKTYTLASGLADAEHSVWIEKRTESYVGAIHFQDLVAAGGKPLVDSPEPFGRMIEVIGDSITCGYGNEGNGPGCSFSNDTENEYLAYEAIAARDLKAKHASISYSGIGVYRNYGGSMDGTMPTKYERTFADDGGSQWTFAYTPDIVVINLGTNDFSVGDPGQAYVDAMKAFVGQVRGHYANAFIVLAVGTMLGGNEHTTVLGYFDSVIAAAGDPKISKVDLGIQDGNADGIGCDYHPSLATHQKMADKLAEHLKGVAGW